MILTTRRKGVINIPKESKPDKGKKKTMCVTWDEFKASESEIEFDEE